ncbi:Holliday junction resolvase RuvX [Pseudoramibacter alactolyticus]|uniref:Holliday junction resolvase RuvX n=1 Tax=Pseudoramibacter alactolyticus TaxID=113287 RepID=UPI00248D815E|nr:Holliday junction resolvase RuvX [Pseudoramibacter alactolyticus]
MTEKILGLDIGDKYVGIAVSDALGVTAQGYRTYKKADRNADLAFFGDVVTQFNIKTAVAGLPKDMDGRETAQARKTKNYCNFLAKRLGLEVIYIDERLTTRASEAVLIAGGVRRENRKQHIDTLSAQLILQMYLDRENDPYVQ